ncbi:type II secretion system protein [Candidatus Riflebacteria bacterium]
MSGEKKVPIICHQSLRKSFTLMELMFVIFILGIMYQTITPVYKKSLLQAKETALRKNLYHMRNAIDLYYRVEERYPESLQILVKERYIRQIPVDPFTRKNDTWTTVPSNEESADVFDLHSGSDKISINNEPYKQW